MALRATRCPSQQLHSTAVTRKPPQTTCGRTDRTAFPQEPLTKARDRPSVGPRGLPAPALKRGPPGSGAPSSDSPPRRSPHGLVSEVDVAARPLQYTCRVSEAPLPSWRILNSVTPSAAGRPWGHAGEGRVAPFSEKDVWVGLATWGLWWGRSLPPAAQSPSPCSGPGGLPQKWTLPDPASPPSPMTEPVRGGSLCDRSGRGGRTPGRPVLMSPGAGLQASKEEAVDTVEEAPARRAGSGVTGSGVEWRGGPRRPLGPHRLTGSRARGQRASPSTLLEPCRVRLSGPTVQPNSVWLWGSLSVTKCSGCGGGLHSPHLPCWAGRPCAGPRSSARRPPVRGPALTTGLSKKSTPRPGSAAGHPVVLV